MSNPISYTSRTYNTILNDINTDVELADKPNWFKRLIAGLGDVLSMYENAIANQSFLRTAFTRQSVADLCALLDYYLAGQTTSNGTLLFYLNPDTVAFPKTILLADLAARSEGTTDISSKKFEARSQVIAASTSETFTTNFAADNNLDVARVYMTGEKVRVSTTGTLPDPLQTGTDYYVIKISDTEIRLANNIVNAYNGAEITLTDDGSGTHTISLYSVQVTAYQQETRDTAALGESDGSTAWQKFDLNDLSVLKETLSITINSVPWTRMDTLVDSTSIDTHYLLRNNTLDNSAKIMFGDGTYGEIPGNFEIEADFAVGGGLDANVSILNRINVYAGSDSDVVGVSNATTFTGASNVEDLDTAKELAPLLLKARDRFVTSADGEALALAYGGISKVTVIKNAYGVLSAKVPIVPTGGGTPGATLKSNLQTYLIDRTILESIDVRVVDPTFITVTIVATVKVLSGYTFAGIKPYIMLALRLLVYESASEIVSDYQQNGIASAIAIINAKWSTSFNDSDYTQIIKLLENVATTDFDKDFQESDILGFIDVFVDGVDYMIISSPAFPITCADDEITTDNILTGNITEIP